MTRSQDKLFAEPARRGRGARRQLFAGLATLLLLALAIVVAASWAGAHPGGLNSEGCHNDRKRGGYHCHGGGSSRAAPARALGLRSSGSGASYANCAAVRAAGAAPIRRGEPGYSGRLDRDGDGVGCE